MQCQCLIPTRLPMPANNKFILLNFIISVELHVALSSFCLQFFQHFFIFLFISVLCSFKHKLFRSFMLFDKIVFLLFVDFKFCT